MAAYVSPLNLPARWARFLPLFWIIVVAIVAILPFVGLGSQLQRQLFLTLTLVLMVSGLNLTFGWAGELSLGVPAMYAAGAYTAGYLAINVVNDVLVGVIVGGVAALLVGLISGIPGLRLGGWTLAIVSFFVVLLIPNIIQIIPADVLGGNIGLIGIPAPMVFGMPLGSEGLFIFALLVTVIWFAVYRNIVKSRIGESLVTLQQGQALAPSLGLSRYRLKLFAYAIGAIPAGMAGALYANLDRFLGLESFTMNLAILVLAASIISGGRSVYAIIFGAAFVQFVNVQSVQFGEFGELIFGALLIVGGVALGGGLSGLVARIARAQRSRRAAARPAAPKEPAQSGGVTSSEPLFGDDRIVGEPVIVDDVHKTFGGVVALEAVSFRAEPGQITALIGPNGSGKTTMLNIAGGFYPVTSGTVSLGDETVSSRAPVAVARAGIARTFQTPLIAEGISTVETVASGSISTNKVSLLATILRLPRYRRTRAAELEKARAILRRLGIERFADDPADSLALGTRRLTELARALAMRPKAILLDEVASGLDTHEVAELASILKYLAKEGMTVVLVEHNFTLVRSLADHIVVLADGKVLTEGTPAEVEAHPEVLKRFLGEMAELSGTSLTNQPEG
jgi:branched-chain amino acid transport system permease protein